MNEALEALTLHFGLVLLRVSACVMALPLLGQLSNLQIKAAIILVLTLVLTAALPPSTPVPEASLLPLLMSGLGEVIIGVAIGTCARLVLLAGELAGQIIGVPMGMGFMQVVDPLSGGQLVVTSRFYVTLSVMIFVGLGGHHSVIFGLASSFRAWPLGAGIPSGDMGWFVSQLAGTLLHAGVSLAAPVLVSILAVQVGLGIIARAAPKVQVFFIGFAMSILVGLLVLMTTAPEIVALLSSLTFSLNDWIPTLFEEARLTP